MARSKHDKTLRAIFADPVRANIPWKSVEAMLANLGATITEGSGSRIRVLLNDAEAVFHRPHPQKETKPSMVRNLRAFLIRAGVAGVTDEGAGDG